MLRYIRALAQGLQSVITMEVCVSPEQTLFHTLRVRVCVRAFLTFVMIDL